MKRFFSAFFIIWVMGQALTACQNEPIEGPNDEPFRTSLLDPSCDPQTAYFQDEILPLLQASCAVSGCHGNGSARRGVDLSSYNSIINTGGINTSNPSSSRLYTVLISSDPSVIMPPPPSNPFTQAEIDEVLLWIEQGAQNNACQE